MSKSPSENKKLANKRSRHGGHIIKKFPSSRELYKFIRSLTKKIPIKGSKKKILKQRKKYHRFLMHLYVGMRQQPMYKDKFAKRKGFIPVYSRLIEREFGRDFAIQLLRKKGIIEIKPHNTMGKKCREFRLTPEIFDQANDIELGSVFQRLRNLIDGNEQADIVNLMTGRREKIKIRSKLTGSHGGIRDTNTPKLIRDSINSLKPCPFNPKYIYLWLKRLNAKYERGKKNYKKAKSKYADGSPELVMAEKEYVRAQGRYLNDMRGAETILNQNPQRLKIKSEKGDLIYEYQAAYSIQKSGRISEINGGFQSSSKYFKHQLFRGIKNMRMNYDLKNSQAQILLQELKACDLKCSWLESYLSDRDAKNKYAAKVGIPAELWKQCFYSLVMGAEVSEERNKFGTVFLNLEDYFKGDTSKTEDAYKRFLKAVRPLIRATEKWRDHIYRTDDSRFTYTHGGIKHWKNACEMHFKEFGIAKGKNGKEQLMKKNLKGNYTKGGNIKTCKRKLAAFILQGHEACFIHHLTAICTDKGIPVYKNEHDGLVTGKKVPGRLVRKAARKANLDYAELKRKPLCNKDQREEMKKYVEG